VALDCQLDALGAVLGAKLRKGVQSPPHDLFVAAHVGQPYDLLLNARRSLRGEPMAGSIKAAKILESDLLTARIFPTRQL